MGARTSNRKRGDDYFTWNYKSPYLKPPNFDSHDNHVSKKPRFSSSKCRSPDEPFSSKSTASRIHQYPESTTGFRREVHAPVRALKFGSTANSRPSAVGVGQREIVADRDRNVRESEYEKTRKSTLDSLRYFKIDKEVIEVDSGTVDDGDDIKEAIGVDSGTVDDGDDDKLVMEVDNETIEEDDDEVSEIENLEDGREGSSLFSEKSSKETSGVVGISPKLEGDCARKMLDSLSLNKGLADVPLYKKLLYSMRRMDPKFNSLQVEIELKWKRFQTLQLFWHPKKPEEDIVTEPFVPLTKEEEADVDRALSNSNRRKVLVNHENSNIEITGEVLQCLRPGAWLNDEVINLYLELLKEREKREPKRFLKCHFFNTFFYKKLIGGRAGYDFKAVRRWTTQRKLGYYLLECDKIFVPIHKEIHWCLAVINKKDEKFQYLDSLGGLDTHVMTVLAKYFVDEVKDKGGNDIDVSSWKQEFVKDLPEQKNGFDCGMFMIKYADFYSRSVRLCFNQENMPYFRRRTAKEILRLKAE
ncbi:unnamed protein product [Ilex paraguariensis]|uniref:Ubiquitin-like protease family profile domain-containing protein n=1 Tax=Ilex paraguariensis TaxID=185542 RepID=A0ABC8RKT1_9AQUA